jgi:hypothetical protein
MECKNNFNPEEGKTNKLNHYICPKCNRIISTNAYDWEDSSYQNMLKKKREMI